MKITSQNLINYTIKDKVFFHLENTNNNLDNQFMTPGLDLWYLKYFDYGDNTQTLNFYIPEYVSFSYSSENLIDETSIFKSCYFSTETQLNNLISFSDTISYNSKGFQITSKTPEIHTSLYFNKLVGVMIAF